MVEVKRKKGESFEAFLRRFTTRLKSSRKLQIVRENQYVQPKINKNKQKKRALIGRKLQAKREYLKKIGKYKEDQKTKL